MGLILVYSPPILGADRPSGRDPSIPHEGLNDSDWSSIRAAYEAGRHQFHAQEDGTHTAENPGLGWTMTYDERGFMATDGSWNWGLELEGDPGLSEVKASGNRLARKRGVVTEWFVNDARGLEQGWILTAPAEIRLRVRGDMKAEVSEQSVSFGGKITYSGLKAWDATGKILSTYFEASAEGFVVRYDDIGARYPITIDPIAQNAYLKASNTGGNDRFGISVAVSGDTVVVGASGEDSNATGVNGNQADNSLSRSGAAYVYVRSGRIWNQQAYLKASNPGEDDVFGGSVAISGDTVVVGASSESSNSIGVNGNQTNNDATSSGAAYVFVRNGSVWSQQAYLKASNTGENDRFGLEVAVSGDTVVVGANEEDSNASGVNGDQGNNDVSLSGAAYVFVRNGSTWSQEAFLKASNVEAFDGFGYSVAVSGDTVIVGASGEDSNATGVNGNEADNSFASSGAAYVFVRSGSTWSQESYLKASNVQAFDGFGVSVAVSGDTVIVGATEESSNAMGVNGNQLDDSLSRSGAAYVFARSGNTWSQQAYLKASNPGKDDVFGGRVAISGDTAVVGAFGEDSNGIGVNGNQDNNNVSFSGAAYVFGRSGTVWSQRAYLKGSNSGFGDQFGISVAVSGDMAVVGAFGESSNATGVNNDQGNNNAIGSGAAYVFQGVGVGEGIVLQSLSRTLPGAPGAADLSYTTPGFPAVNGSGRVMFDHGLGGAGAAGGRNRGIFSTLGPASTVEMAFQSGNPLADIAWFGVGTKVSALGSPLCNRPGLGLFLATASGPGLTSANNRVLFGDNGVFVSALRRTGLTVNEWGGAAPSVFGEVLQSLFENLIAIPCKLKASSGTSPAVTSRNDSGLLLLSHEGALVNATPPREGDPAYGDTIGSTFGTFGEFTGRAANGSYNHVHFGALLIPPTGLSLPAIFETTTGVGAAGKRVAQAGDVATGAVPATSTFSSFPALTQANSFALYRAKLKGTAASGNEGIWISSSGSVVVLKGDDLGSAGLPSVRIGSIVRFWPMGNMAGSPQVVVQVTLTGSGVTSANRSALLLKPLSGNYQLLLRTGDRAPGAGPATVLAIQAVDVNPASGHYAVLGSLKGAKSSDNQALWAGNANLGMAGDSLRLPILRLQKGERYQSTATPLGTIKSLSIKPAVDPTGAGGRGLAQVVGSGGHIAVSILTDRNVTEQVLLGP
jgi:hypothetical protein